MGLINLQNEQNRMRVIVDDSIRFIRYFRTDIDIINGILAKNKISALKYDNFDYYSEIENEIRPNPLTKEFTDRIFGYKKHIEVYGVKSLELAINENLVIDANSFPSLKHHFLNNKLIRNTYRI